jgi:hypothetical protein
MLGVLWRLAREVLVNAKTASRGFDPLEESKMPTRAKTSLFLQAGEKR